MIYIFKGLVILLSLYAMAKFGSIWINNLYLNNQEILSYPEKIYKYFGKYKYFRQLVIFVALCIGFLMLPDMNEELMYIKMVLIYFLILTVCTDFEQEIIFDLVLIPLAIFSILFTYVTSALLSQHLIAAFAGGGLFLLLAIFTGAIGGGDIKLIAVIGLMLGIENLIDVILIGAVTGGVVALVLLISGKKQKKDFFAYGLYFACAAIFKIIFG